jgi:CubicO group peptidase (beta-lactamase class C family)
MKQKLSILALALALTVTASAQQRKMVRVGGGGEDPAKDWPKIEGKAADLGAELDRYLETLTSKELFSGTVLVARNGQPVYFKSYGLANREWNVPNTNDTRYSIGSINKIFTKYALLQLRDAGKIDFSKTLRTYLPDYPSAIADKVTIQQLLTHRAGLGDIFGDEYDALPKDGLRSLRDYLPLFVEKPLEFEPGTRQRYSNASYVLLGLVIEKLSGMSYYDYIRTKIYAPAGMADTDSYEYDAIVPRRATGYTRGGMQAPKDAPLRANVYTKPAKPSSAGGGYSTAMDLLRFTRALPKILGPSTYEQELGPVPGIGFGGGAPGINAAVEVEGDVAIIVLSNYDPPAASAVARSVRAALGLPVE